MNKLRLAFMGSPDFSVTVLRALKDAGHDIAAVYTQPPKPAGRGHKLQQSPVHAAADEMGLTVRTPKTLRDVEEQKIFSSLNLDIAIVAAYGLILPQAILDAPKHGCINVHFSLLPRWRGAMPVQWAILSGDKETGVDIMQMAAGLDTGDILMREKVTITPSATPAALLPELATRAAPLVLSTIQQLVSGTAKPQPQPAEGSTYASKLTRDNGHIDWTKSAAEIERQIRALQPWPGCFFMLGEEAIKLLAAEVIKDKSGAPGTLLDDNFTIACGRDALKLIMVQRAGKNPTDGASLLRGLRLPVGHKL